MKKINEIGKFNLYKLTNRKNKTNKYNLQEMNNEIEAALTISMLVPEKTFFSLELLLSIICWTRKIGISNEFIHVTLTESIFIQRKIKCCLLMKLKGNVFSIIQSNIKILSMSEYITNTCFIHNLGIIYYSILSGQTKAV